MDPNKNEIQNETQDENEQKNDQKIEQAEQVLQTKWKVKTNLRAGDPSGYISNKEWME